VFWVAIILSGLVFGWAHLDTNLPNPGAPVGALAMVMTWSSLLGILYGWIFWKLGLEWAMAAHFMYDAMISAVVVPVYLLDSLLVWFALVAGLLLVAAIAWRVLARPELHAGSQ
jgi:membrane protease YdiL (CAAX protease family)